MAELVVLYLKAVIVPLHNKTGTGVGIGVGDGVTVLFPPKSG
jgi:hypothetical protein